MKWFIKRFRVTLAHLLAATLSLDVIVLTLRFHQKIAAFRLDSDEDVSKMAEYYQDVAPGLGGATEQRHPLALEFDFPIRPRGFNHDDAN